MKMYYLIHRGEDELRTEVVYHDELERRMNEGEFDTHCVLQSAEVLGKLKLERWPRNTLAILQFDLVVPQAEVTVSKWRIG